MNDTPFPKPPATLQTLPDADRHRSLLETRAARPAGSPVWIFGFGSLMWRPEGDYDALVPAYLHGYERRFHIWSLRGRGSPEKPGLGLCLEDCAGGCHGVAYRLVEETLDESFEKIWSREMRSGTYKPTWVAVDTEEFGRIPALTFVVNKGHWNYAGPQPMDVMAAYMSQGCGDNGRCRDYLANTVEELRKLKRPDPYLEELLAEVDARCAGQAD